MGIAAVSAPTYVAETCPPKQRPLALGLYYACWGVGTMIASGVCYSVRPLLSSVPLPMKLTVSTLYLDVGLAYPEPGSDRSQHSVYDHLVVHP